MKLNGAQWAVVVGVLILVLAVVATFSGHDKRRGDSTISSIERAKQLAKQGKREQVISFAARMTPLGDEAKSPTSLYAIGVSQFTLGTPESIEPLRSGGYRGFNGSHGSSGDYSYPSGDVTVDGPFNNILVYDKQTGAAEKTFNKRVSISSYTVVLATEPNVVAIIASQADSNHDGLVDRNDLQELYVYSLQDRQLHQVTGLNASAEAVLSVPDVNYLVVAASMDKNSDGTITHNADGDKELEPRSLFRIDLHSFVATPLIPAALTKELQDTLDGLPSVPAPK